MFCSLTFLISIRTIIRVLTANFTLYILIYFYEVPLICTLLLSPSSSRSGLDIFNVATPVRIWLAAAAKKDEKSLDKSAYPLYNLKAVKNAAIAQSVERILGKDEVASSNLASSSKK